MSRNSNELFKRARAVMPSGASSPVRGFGAVGGEPRFMRRGQGSRIEDVDGREYVDYVGGAGALILGHAAPSVVAAVMASAERGLGFGASNEAEVVLAEMVTEAMETVDSLRLVSCDTQALGAVLRLARSAKRRDLVVKVDACRHGSVDSLLLEPDLVAPGQIVTASRGVPRALVAETLVVPFNDMVAIQELVEARGDELACIILEPVPTSSGLILPRDGYLDILSELCGEYGILLVFDELATGFRLGFGGAQALYGVRPDLTCLGRILGGGLPLAAFGGRKPLMDELAPAGEVVQTDVLAGSPLAVAAGIETLRQLKVQGVYETLEERTARLARGLEEAAAEAGVPVSVEVLGSCLTLYFNAETVVDRASALRSDTGRYARYFHAMLEEGIYLPPSQFETCYVSTMHGDEEIDRTLEAARKAFPRAAS